MTDLGFLERLLNAPGPSGFEVRAARVWREEAQAIAEEVHADSHGNTAAVVNPGGRPRLMLAGHIDEIGLMITHVDERGYLHFDEIGGWDAEVLVGQRVRVLARDREVPGVVGKKPIHLIKKEERDKASRVRDLWIDVGTLGADEVRAFGIRVGDPVVLDAPLLRLAGDRIVCRSVDDRVGAYVVLEALRRLAADRPSAAVMAVATVQEEISYHGGGAQTSAFALEPDVALVVDVTFSTDVPDVDKKELGDHRIGGGPVLTRGSAAHPLVFELLAEVAAEAGIEHTIQAAARSTRTDADVIRWTRSGVPTGLISIPNRYMHTPNEMVSVSDLDRAIRLIDAFARRLTPETDFTIR
ncbi:MAG: M42 family metallopeptidase [Gemmatimonadetes bacterium]|nr:M42 family metallopeptidase [Gemmatimonadota bacterium]